MLERKLLRRKLGRFGLLAWPVRSPYVNLLHFLWGLNEFQRVPQPKDKNTAAVVRAHSRKFCDVRNELEHIHLEHPMKWRLVARKQTQR